MPVKIYTYLEENALDIDCATEIVELFAYEKRQLSDAGDHENAKKAEYEMEAFSLIPINGSLKGQFADRFKDRQIQYYKERLKKTKNIRLKAHYAHILWDSKSKHSDYAKIAIDSYIELTRHFEKRYKKPELISPIGWYDHSGIIKNIKCAFKIAIASKSKKDQVLDEIKRLINDEDINKHTKYVHAIDLIQLLIDERKHYDKNILKDLSEFCSSNAKELKDNGNFHYAIRLLEEGRYIVNIFKNNVKIWDLEIGDCYEKMMINMNNDAINAGYYCQLAIKYYSLAGDNNRVTELANKREEFNRIIDFNVMTFPVNTKYTRMHYMEVGLELAKLSTEEIIFSITNDINILPKYNEIESIVKSTAKEAPLSMLVRKTVLDSKMHISNHVDTAEEKIKYEMVEAFKFFFRTDKQILIRAIMDQAYEADKLDAEKIFLYLREKSWIGKNFEYKYVRKNNEFRNCWLDQIKQPIRVYFDYMRRKEDKNVDLPIMEVDSLTLKFEGMIRDFADKNGISTYYDRSCGHNRITREKDLNMLLYEKQLKDLINPSDLLFFKVLFVEQSGYNIRNKVAHSLMRTVDYSFDLLEVILIAILRLSKYNLMGGAFQGGSV